MSTVQERNGEIIFLEKVPNGVRVFLSIIGLLPMLYTPYQLLIRPGWSEFSISLLFSIILSIGAFVLGGLFMLAGLFGLDRTLRFSRTTRMVVYSYRSVFLPLRGETYRFNDVAKLEIKTHDWTDGPSTHALQFTFTNGKKIEMGSFKKRSEAEEYLRKVENLVQ